MFITRASRHDLADIERFVDSHGESSLPIGEGRFMIARDGGVVGCVRIVEVEPQTLVFATVLVEPARRGEGIGRSLVQAAMNNKGGTIYLSCHEDRLDFYARLGFERIDPDAAPAAVTRLWERGGDFPTEPGHVHHYLKAR